MKNNFYQLTSDEESAELYIYGDITSYKWYESDVCSYDLSKELNDLEGKDLTVRINSYGGDVSEGLAIYNLLKDYKGKVTTKIDGFACSSASVIFMAGKERIMPKTSLLFIHNAWTYASGDSNELKKVAEELEKITKPSLEIYKSNSNLNEDEIKEMMDKETWMTSSEALEYGFATKEVEENAKQSLRDEMMSKLVLKIKKMEKESKEPVQKKGWFFKCQN